MYVDRLSRRKKRNRRKYHFSGFLLYFFFSFFVLLDLFFGWISEWDEEENLPAQRTNTCALHTLAIFSFIYIYIYIYMLHYGHKQFFSSSFFRYSHLIFIRNKCLEVFVSPLALLPRSRPNVLCIQETQTLFY